jgi:hypothetical protein
LNVKRRGGGIVLLERQPSAAVAGGRLVVVPDIAAIDQGMLTAILRSAGVSDADFRRLVASQSGMFTKAGGDAGGDDEDRR